MKHKLSVTLALVVLTMAIAVGVARAQTVAPGPYYANPSWDQKLACDTVASCPRFIVLSNWGSEAVLDRETGLVWQRTPVGSGDFFSGQVLCALQTTGGRQGWRLPSFQELQSLIDPSVADPVALPAGHPFVGVSQFGYWTATSFLDTINAWIVEIRAGSGHFFVKNKTTSREIWCVRGGGPIAVY
jgi:hypothetical protein